MTVKIPIRHHGQPSQSQLASTMSSMQDMRSAAVRLHESPILNLCWKYEAQSAHQMKISLHIVKTEGMYSQRYMLLAILWSVYSRHALLHCHIIWSIGRGKCTGLLRSHPRALPDAAAFKSVYCSAISFMQQGPSRRCSAGENTS